MHDRDEQTSPTMPARAMAAPGTVGVAVYDANCLFSKHVRFVLLAFAVHGTVQARQLSVTAASSRRSSMRRRSSSRR